MVSIHPGEEPDTLKKIEGLKMEEIRFAHVSDTHIVAAGSSAFLHRVQREVRDPLENLKECLAALSC